MNNIIDFKVSNSIIRIIGVFETTGRLQTNVKNFKDSNYKEEEIDTNNSFIKNYTEISPKKSIENMRKQNNMYTKSDNENDLTKWIKQNSIIEIIFVNFPLK